MTHKRLRINTIYAIIVIFLLAGCIQRAPAQVTPTQTFPEVKAIEVELIWKYFPMPNELFSLASASPIAVGFHDGNLYLFKAGKIEWNRSYGNISVISLSPSGRHIGIYSSNMLSLLDDQGDVLWNYEVNNITAITLSDEILLAQTNKGDIYLFSIEGELTQKLSFSSVTDIIISTTGEYIAVLAINKTPVFIDPWQEGGYLGTDVQSSLFLFNSEGLLQLKEEVNDLITGVSTGGNLVGISSTHLQSAVDLNRPFYVFDINGNKLWDFSAENGFWDISISSDGKFLVAGSRDRNVYFFDERGNLLWKYKTDEWVRAVSVSERGNYIIALSQDTYLYLLDRKGKLHWKYDTGLPLLFPETLSISEEENYIGVLDFRGIGSPAEAAYLYRLKHQDAA